MVSYRKTNINYTEILWQNPVGKQRETCETVADCATWPRLPAASSVLSDAACSSRFHGNAGSWRRFLAQVGHGGCGGRTAGGCTTPRCHNPSPTYPSQPDHRLRRVTTTHTPSQPDLHLRQTTNTPLPGVPPARQTRQTTCGTATAIDMLWQ